MCEFFNEIPVTFTKLLTHKSQSHAIERAISPFFVRPGHMLICWHNFEHDRHLKESIGYFIRVINSINKFCMQTLKIV